MKELGIMDGIRELNNSNNYQVMDDKLKAVSARIELGTMESVQKDERNKIGKAHNGVCSDLESEKPETSHRDLKFQHGSFVFPAPR